MRKSDFILEPSIYISIPSAQPVTCGLPWPRSALFDANSLQLRDPADRTVPLQTRPLERWPDGSIRWLLLDWQSSGSGTYRVHIGPSVLAPTIICISELSEGLLVDTGAARFSIHRTGALPFAQAELLGTPLLNPSCCGLRLTDQQGRACTTRVDQFRIEEAGPLRACIVAEGVFLDTAAHPLIDFELEYHFFAGLATVRLHYTLRNPRAARHPGGLWDLGDPGSVLIRDASVTLAVNDSGDPATIACSPEIDQPWQTLSPPFELYQDSSGGVNWRSSNHLNRHHQIPLRFRGYRIRHQLGESNGLRANPIVLLRRGAKALGVAVPEFWQNFPRAIEADSSSLSLRLFPQQSADLHELQGGEQKTHIFYLTFGVPANDNALEWCRQPAIPHADPSWYAAAEAVPHLLPSDEDNDPGYSRLVGQAIDGENSFDHKREVMDEYGWRHFGDIYGDHEAVFHKGPTPLVSHYNNQYDPIQGFAVQFFRTGDTRWWRHMNELAWHVIDIDIYHTDSDKSAYNHGLFWHTVHYVDADTCTHRTYPKAGKVSGGGPANEHNYPTGLMLHYFLTGNRASRNAAIELARWVIDMDDGRKTIFRWLARGPSGLASSSRTPTYHGPGRGAANSVSALIDGHRLTGEPSFLTKAEELIRRVIHPQDDIPSRNLLDAENRWFYTMFLQSLGKYLNYKVELGQFDTAYAYARASLLHYAKWMVDNEYPYLEKPEILEYPTETWAAQDMRKSEVFWFAWLHAEESDRERFRERARFFFNYSLRTLEKMPTRHLCRPVVLLLSHGYQQAWFEKNPHFRAPQPTNKPESFGKPMRFVPQKVRAVRRLKQIIVASVGLLLIGSVYAVYYLYR
jgi:hypothetical protein